MKGMIVPGTLFEELGFNYIGPIDGHDIPTLLTTLSNIRELSGPQFLHIVTQKGKGFEAAENEPTEYHAAAPGFYTNGKTSSSASDALTYTEVFSRWILDAAAKDERLIGITPAMREGSGLVEFSEQFSERYYDVGIAEQHSVTLAAGMACDGLKPVVAIYSSFLQRAYDQLIHDVALQNLPVVFAIDRGGIVGADGATHTGSFDLSFMRCIPNMTIMAPADENESYHMLDFAFAMDLPTAIRYPRSKGVGQAITEQLPQPLEAGKSIMVYDNQSDFSAAELKLVSVISILSFGTLLSEALSAAKALKNEFCLKIINMRFIKPLDNHIALQLAQNSDLLITLEDNAVMGGAGSAVNEVLAGQGSVCPVLNLGLPDEFPEHGTQQEIHHDYDLDSAGLVKTIREHIRPKSAAV